MWYHRVIGGKRCPIVDTWWQTETGGIMITPLPAAVPTQARLRDAAVPRHRRRGARRRRQGRHRARAAASSRSASRGPACCAASGATRSATRRPTGASGRSTYFPGDGAHRDEHGLLLDHRPHRRRDERLGPPHRHDGGRERDRVAREGRRGRRRRPPRRAHRHRDRRVRDAARRHARGRRRSSTSSAHHVTKHIGAIAKPADIRFTDALPKTRSGKIMRRLLRDIAAGKETIGDTTHARGLQRAREAARERRGLSRSSSSLLPPISPPEEAPWSRAPRARS